MSGEMIMELPATLELETRDDIAILSLNRIEKRNAINDELVFGLESFFRQIPEGIKAIILTARGDNFSAGLDLSDIVERSTIEGVKHSMSWHRAFELIEFSPVPVICVMKGAVVGGGLELASSTHIRIAEDSTYYSLPEGQRGIFVGGGASVRVPRLVGVSVMTDMMLTGRLFNADEGAKLGLSNYRVADGEGLAKGLEVARKVADNSPMTNFAVIQALPRIAESNPGQAFMMESMMAAIAQGSEEAKGKLRAFLEKRAKKVTEF
jgi:(methylthio)acryloyl-CoA hydratase